MGWRIGRIGKSESQSGYTSDNEAVRLICVIVALGKPRRLSSEKKRRLKRHLDRFRLNGRTGQAGRGL